MDIVKLKNAVNKLPKVPSILEKEQYFNSAVLVLMVMIDEEYHFLFQQRASNIRQEGEICFPGGEYDPKIDKSYEQTAIRETIEELGIKRDRINVLGRQGTIVAPMGATVDSFIGVLEIDDLDKLNVNEEEVAEVFTLPVSYFEKHKPEKHKVRLEVQPSYIDESGEKRILLPVEELGLPTRYTKPWGGKEYNIYVYKFNGKVIWGITAQLIYDFIKKLD